MIIFSVFLILVTQTYLDYKYYHLSDYFNLLLLIIGLICNLNNLVVSIIGIICGFLSLWLIRTIYYNLNYKDGLGLGDCKLLGAIGAYCGWQPLGQIIFFASCIGIISAFFLKLVVGRDIEQPLAFGPCICIASIPAIIGIDLIGIFV